MVLTIKEPNNPKYSFFVMFSRKWMISKWFKCFFNLNLDIYNTELIFIVDNDDSELFGRIKQFCQFIRYFDFNGIRIYKSPKKKLKEYRPDAEERRQRTRENLEIAKELIQGKYVLGIEDDTLCKKETFSRMLNIIENKDDVGFVEAVEVGRWFYPIIGAWKIKKDEYRTVRRGQGIEEIDAGGLYCFVARSDLFKKTPERMEVVGPDVELTYNMRKLGYKCLIDWDLWCEHHTIQGKVLDELTKTVEVVWKKKNGKFALTNAIPYEKIK